MPSRKVSVKCFFAELMNQMCAEYMDSDGDGINDADDEDDDNDGVDDDGNNDDLNLQS